MTLLDRTIDLLCGAQSGFVSGSMPDVDWQNAKDKLLKDYRESRGVAQAAGMQEVLDFLNKIEGDGYGGMASFEIAREHVRSALPSTTCATPVMRAAENAAKVVDGWSDAKKDYAERVTASSVSSTNLGDAT